MVSRRAEFFARGWAPSRGSTTSCSRFRSGTEADGEWPERTGRGPAALAPTRHEMKKASEEALAGPPGWECWRSIERRCSPRLETPDASKVTAKTQFGVARKLRSLRWRNDHEHTKTGLLLEVRSTDSTTEPTPIASGCENSRLRRTRLYVSRHLRAGVDPSPPTAAGCR